MKSLASPITSVWISLLSGTSLIAIVSFFPTKPILDESPQNSVTVESSKKEDSSLPSPPSRSQGKVPSTQNYKILQTRPLLPTPKPEEDSSNPTEGETWGFHFYQKLIPGSRANLPQIPSSTLADADRFQRGQFFRSQRSRLVAEVGLESGRWGMWDRYLSENQKTFREANIISPSSLSLRYKLSNEISAIFYTGHTDIHSSLRTNPSAQVTSLGGFDFAPSKNLSTRFLAESDVAYRNPLTATSESLITSNANDLGRDYSRNYDWETQIQPTKWLRMQSGIARITKNAYSMVYSPGSVVTTPDTGRFGLSYGSQRIQLDMRYMYYNQSGIQKDTFSTMNSFQTGRDNARLGIQLALDPQDRFSLFLGNEFYNIATNPNVGNRRAISENASRQSFSATFKGRTGKNNSSFFLNLQNNSLFLDPFFYGASGGNRTTGNLYESKTSIGMEIFF